MCSGSSYFALVNRNAIRCCNSRIVCSSCAVLAVSHLVEGFISSFRFLRAFFRETRVLGQSNNKLYAKVSPCPCFRSRLGSVRGNLPLVWNNLVLHPTRQREGFAGRTSLGAAFTAAGTLVLHGPRSSAVAVVWESSVCSSCRCAFLLVRASFPLSIFVSFFS